MSNRYHLVVKIDAKRVSQWSSHEVVARWTCLYSGPSHAQRFLQGEPLAEFEYPLLERDIAKWIALL